MKIDRLIGIITILLRNEKTTAPELAERFEVSRRTINRDIEDICKAGIPVVSTQGYGGGFSIADGYKLDKSLFTKDELQTIFAGLRGMDSVSKSSALSSLLDKFSSKEQRVIAEDMIIIDLASHYQTSLTQKIELLKSAIRRKHILSFQYYYEKGEAKRRIEPYRLIFKWSAWYVYGFCLDRQAYRLFKLNRLWDLQIDEETFSEREIPQEELSFGNYFAEGTFRLKAVFAKSEKHRLIEEYGIDSYSVCQDERLLFERDFASYENMREWVFSFGDKVSVLAPDELQDDRKKQAENIIKMYEEKEKDFVGVYYDNRKK
ncbi:helix-turn-helix transcriptional regulator [Ihubacter sp. rT4E-8]|uniref:helix-turn-helix transcriptional regulator n=1 Tax=Ihubacter sp. rT4E-8 TaxID=3242369 RepID=UPI003CEBF2E7